MQRVHEVARRALATQTQPTNSETGPKQEARKRAAAVWEGLKQIFGTSFLTIHGETPSRYWLGAIAKLTDDQCRDGLARVVGMKREYPVNLTEFVEACKPRQGVRFLGTPTSPEELRKALPRNVASPEKVDAHLAKLRKLVADVTVKPKPEPEPEEKPLLSGAALDREKARQLEALMNRWPVDNRGKAEQTTT